MVKEQKLPKWFKGELYEEGAVVQNRFGGGEIEITASASTAADVKVVKGDFPDIFKYEEDYILAKSLAKDIFNEEFLLTAQGDYEKEEIEAIKSWKHGKKSR